MLLCRRVFVFLFFGLPVLAFAADFTDAIDAEVEVCQDVQKAKKIVADLNLENKNQRKNIENFEFQQARLLSDLDKIAREKKLWTDVDEESFAKKIQSIKVYADNELEIKKIEEFYTRSLENLTKSLIDNDHKKACFHSILIKHSLSGIFDFTRRQWILMHAEKKNIIDRRLTN